MSHNASSCGATTGSIRQQPCREDNTTTSSVLHSTVPSALIHHHPPPPSSNPSTPSSSNSYPSSSHPNSPGYHLGMGNAGQPYQQQQQQQQQGGGGGGAGGNRGNASSAAAASVYSAKVLAFQQGSNRQAPPASMGLSSGNSSQSSRPPSADDSADSFFHFDSISSHQQPYQHPHHLSFPPPGPLHPSELQLAGKHYLVSHPKKNKIPTVHLYIFSHPVLIYLFYFFKFLFFPSCRPFLPFFVCFFPCRVVVVFFFSTPIHPFLCIVFCPASCPYVASCSSFFEILSNIRT